MGKKNKVNLSVDGIQAKNQTEFIELLRGHYLLQSCSLNQLIDETGSQSGIGHLVWARNPGSVYWPALIAAFEDKPEVKTEEPSEDEPVVAPEVYRSVMFLESAFRFSLLGWKDLILVDEDNVELQRDLVVKYNRFIIKKSWREEKPFKEAVELLLEFTKLPVSARQNHAFNLCLKKKESKPKRTSLKPVTEPEPEEDEVITITHSVSNSTVSMPKRRDSDRYTFRQIPSRELSPASTPSASVVALSTPRSNSPTSEGHSSKSGEIETLSDLSRKHRKRPKVGGQELKAYAEDRFMCIDKAYRFEKNDVHKCAKCMENIESGQMYVCHELPHHRSCLKMSKSVGKDGTVAVFYKCQCCLEGLCFLCKQKDCKDEVPVKCCKCDLKFHRSCLEAWPQAVIQGSNGPITCPAHFCHTCFGEQRVYNKQRNFKVFSGNKFRCLLCLSTYHKPYCVPAGCGENISGNNFIVCPRHTLPKLPNKQNRFGCLGCGIVLKRKDVEIIECTLCLQNFHASCVGYSEKHKVDGLSVETFGRDYKCRSCLMGLFPIYGQVVWFQQKPHSYWPARTLFPRESSGRSEYSKKEKVPGEYSIKYFGSVPSFYDKASRTFPIHLTTVKLFTLMGIYHENEKIKSSYDEAEFFHQLVEQFRDEYLPVPTPFYKRIERNIYRNYSAPTKKKSENTGPCLCHLREDEKACTPISGCHNRDTAVECNDSNCVSGEKCHNRMFTQKGKESENTEQFLCRNKGWAVRAAKNFEDGDFITEYCGEIINSAEMQYRANKKSEEDPLYLLEIDKHTFIDAEYCGNVSRLINHSCEPNCRTEKYTAADGRPVVGVFAQASIQAGEELTFDYAYGTESAAPFRCHCGAENCRGFIGKTAPDDYVPEVFNPEDDTHDKQCSKCTFGGYVLCCSYEGCCKVYHKTCANVSREPEGDWFCPDHVTAFGVKRKTSNKGTGSEPLSKRQKPVLLKRNRISPNSVTAKCKRSNYLSPDSVLNSSGLSWDHESSCKQYTSSSSSSSPLSDAKKAYALTLEKVSQHKPNGLLCHRKKVDGEEMHLVKTVREKNLLIVEMPAVYGMVKVPSYFK